MTCAEACPLGAVFIHQDVKTPITCDLCMGDPECVKWCPTKALEFTTPTAAYQTRRMDAAMKKVEEGYSNA
jgi:Fe-S-cluster-containing hydrogenase component 2